MLDGALSPRAIRAPRDERGEQIGPNVLAGWADLVGALEPGEQHANH